MCLQFEFTGPDMLRYAWKNKGDINRMTLNVYPSKQIVAVYRHNTAQMDARDVIEVYPPAQHMQDFVIATGAFLVCVAFMKSVPFSYVIYFN